MTGWCGAPFVMRSHDTTGKPNPITAFEVADRRRILAAGAGNEDRPDQRDRPGLTGDREGEGQTRGQLGRTHAEMPMAGAAPARHYRAEPRRWRFGCRPNDSVRQAPQGCG
jgi:hypothetical protein